MENNKKKEKQVS